METWPKTREDARIVQEDISKQIALVLVTAAIVFRFSVMKQTD
ncbi:MAG: hypothetical protein Q8K51_07040 [Nitrospirota bacterium]|nr:hypothetical protein [Nitrospirota bacterium]